MNYYQTRKKSIKNQAINWQKNIEKYNYSLEELYYYQEYFYRLGKKYGLLKIFKNNGIC